MSEIWFSQWLLQKQIVGCRPLWDSSLFEFRYRQKTATYLLMNVRGHFPFSFACRAETAWFVSFFCCVFYSLFNLTMMFSCSGYLPSIETLMQWTMNRVGFGNRSPWAVSLYSPRHTVGKSVSFIVNGYGIKIRTVCLQNTSEFHCFTVHFDSLSFIHTNSCTFSYKYVLVF